MTHPLVPVRDSGTPQIDQLVVTAAVLGPDLLELALHGVVQYNTLSVMRRAFESDAIGTARTIQLNLSKTLFVSSVGWAGFMAFAEKMSQAGRHVVLCHMPESVSQAYQLLGLEKMIESRP